VGAGCRSQLGRTRPPESMSPLMPRKGQNGGCEKKGTTMNRMVLQSRVGADGVLHISVPIGKEDADRDVEVTIDPARAGSPQMTQEEWREFVLRTAGSITDPSFVRHEQGEYERRRIYRDAPARHEFLRRPLAARSRVECYGQARCRWSWS
jgi:hypothetical protein